ncbi:Response regulator receiver domain-containing protein [Bosea lupini]|uniref:Response regulator receiver domain-containing protein n=1 Tax=Bosea lupini TaxID=1036779 RepID=A0A1H7WEG1_9HYPH|nr:response regulator [Bosea lupini]SEM19982.1 Response regulator receiver domain-containing protein [Bosea lupini]
MLKGKAILVVEDEPMIAMVLDDLLTDLGCSVVGPAHNIAQAQSLIGTNTCDAAIVDLNLNGTMSHPLIEALIGKGVPVIVATGYGGSAPDLPSGCRVLAKPYTIEHVEQVLRACLPD